MVIIYAFNLTLESRNTETKSPTFKVRDHLSDRKKESSISGRYTEGSYIYIYIYVWRQENDCEGRERVLSESDCFTHIREHM